MKYLIAGLLMVVFVSTDTYEITCISNQGLLLWDIAILNDTEIEICEDVCVKNSWCRYVCMTPFYDILNTSSYIFIITCETCMSLKNSLLMGLMNYNIHGLFALW